MQVEKSLKNGVCNMALSGQLTFSDSRAFREAIINQVMADNIQHITLQMAAVIFIDSAGLGMMLLLRDEAEKHQKLLTIVGLAGQVKKIFQVARFDALFTLQETA